MNEFIQRVISACVLSMPLSKPSDFYSKVPGFMASFEEARDITNEELLRLCGGDGPIPHHLKLKYPLLDSALGEDMAH